jgi:hypothetical protein
MSLEADAARYRYLCEHYIKIKAGDRDGPDLASLSIQWGDWPYEKTKQWNKQGLDAVLDKKINMAR